MEAIPDEDGHVRSVEVEYKNPIEKLFRRMLRPIQKVVVIVLADYCFEDHWSEAKVTQDVVAAVPEPAAVCQETA